MIERGEEMGNPIGYMPAQELKRITDLRVVARFVKKLVQPQNGCWEWRACRTKKGYGRFHLAGATRWAHRVAYAIFVGDIPEGLTVDHDCHNPACCRPDHLLLVSYENNLKRKIHQHRWVLRKDGYEEQCTPAICESCGKYGCRCDWIRDLGRRPNEDEEAFFEARGINGNDHELEKSLCT